MRLEGTKAMIFIMKIPTAYGYVRYSSEIQGEGDSIRRQVEAIENYAATNILNLKIIMKDEGMSAFTGKNVKDGHLGRFIKDVEAERIEAGSYLLVESHSRLSRQTPMEALSNLHRIINGGVKIVTLMDGAIYEKDAIGLEKLLMTVIGFGTSYKESSDKRNYSLDNWEKKRKNAGKKKLTKTCPGWLTLSDDREDWIENKERVRLVRRVYRMSLDGLGAYAITKILNKEDVSPFGRSKHWQSCSIKHMLKNRAVLGEFQSYKRTTCRKGRIAVGEPELDYYPAIIGQADFYANQAIMAGRSRKASGRKGKRYVNLFSGIAFCSECGAKMHLKQRDKRHGGTALVCSAVEDGACEAKNWLYEQFEKSFLKFVNEIDVETIIKGGTGSRSDTITNRFNQLEGQRTETEGKRTKLLELYESGGVDLEFVQTKIKAHSEAIAKFDVELERLNKERMEIHDSRRQSREAGRISFPNDISDEELYALRAKAAEHIRGVVESIDMIKRPLNSPAGRMDSKYRVRFKGGSSRVVFPDSQDAKDAWAVVNMDFEQIRYENGSLPKATKTAAERNQLVTIAKLRYENGTLSKATKTAAERNAFVG